MTLPDVDGLSFATGDPFPHVVVDSVLDEAANDLVECFPSPEWTGWRRYGDDYQPNKLICSDIEAIPPTLRTVIEEFHAPRFLEWLEALTGIDALLPDPYLEGGGLHCSGPGGVLTPHTDFHIYPRLNLYRRVNVILYLNPGWNASDGGCLELFHKGSRVATRRIVPEWGTMVVFRTDDRSVHGFPAPVADGRWRRSIALYFYTAADTSEFAGDTNTYWQAHGAAQGVRAARLKLYQALLYTSRACSWAAHRINPNLGARARVR